MKSFSSGVTAALASGRIKARAFMLVQLVEATYGFWNDVGTIVEGGVTYYGTGALAGISAVAGVTNLSTPAITYTLSGLDAKVLQSFFTYTWHQQPISLYLGLLDSSDTLIDSLQLMASGRMDTAKLKGGKDKTASLVITAEDVSRRLSWRNPTVRSDADQRQRYATDVFMAYVATTAERQLYWGQKQPKAPPVFSHNPLTMFAQMIKGGWLSR